MKKITTIFVRDWDGELGPPARFVTRNPHPDAAWVFAGEGIPTKKIDGTSCLVRDGKLYKRHEVRPGKATPDGFEEVERDDETGKVVGWIPVGQGPEDKWHRQALDVSEALPDGTYELIGPKVQGNPEDANEHMLVAHSANGVTDAAEELEDVPLDYDGLREYLDGADMEGIVWHHPDGRMAKIKGKDFGVSRAA